MRFHDEPGFAMVPGLSPAVKTILIATLGVFFLQLALLMTSGMRLTGLFGLSRGGVLHGFLWQFVTYIFLHGGMWHIFLNMLMLVMFGREIEGILGSRRFLGLYIGCGILGGLGWVLISGRSPAACIGASGAVFGVLGTFAALFPERRLTLLLFFVLPVTMSARTMAIGMGVISLFSLMGGPDGNIAHAAHLAGGLAGYLYGRQLKRRSWNRGRNGWRVISREEESALPPAPEEIDRILEKIKGRGIGSLNRAERDVLDRASRQGRE
jgi:membrane associated rhomboid family serine protease